MSLTGAILGDIAGSRFEFLDNISNWETCDLFHKDSVFTDDTVQNLAIGLAIISNNNYAQSLHNLCNKYLFVGYGGFFHKWLQDIDTPYCNSWANGSAMRVAAIGEFASSLQEAEHMAIESALCTHNSEEGKKGAKAIAGCIYLARTGAAKDEILNYAQALYPSEEYEYHPGRPLNEYRSSYKFEVSCQTSVPVAIRCFIESNNYESCIRNVYYVNGDTDTLGSMAGAIAGASYGLNEFNYEDILKKFLDDELYNYWCLINKTILSSNKKDLQ